MRPSQDRSSRWLGAAVASSLAVLLALMPGCVEEPFGTNPDFDPDSLPNQPPVARIFVDDDEEPLGETSYNQASFHWSGTDVDGFVVGFHVSIVLDGAQPTDWIFTTNDDSTATYETNLSGAVTPTLYVVAEDDRGALSDTVSTTFPLVNFPPVLEFIREFTPPTQSFGAATFQLLGFDLDGDETLLPWVDYRFEGADPELVYQPDDAGADPSLGWVRSNKSPVRFGLALRGIPAGDPGLEYEQTIYIRIVDEAGAEASFSHTWQVFEVRGSVLLMDDALTVASRDVFYQDALSAHLGDEFSTWDVSGGLPANDEELWLTISQFTTLVWYTGGGASANLRRAEGLLQRFLNEDLHPAEPGIQSGRILIENQAAAGASSNLSSAFRAQVLGIESSTLPRNPLATYNSIVERDIGPLEIFAQDPSLPDIVSVGENYLGGSGRFFGLVGLKPLPGTTSLWRFEEYKWGGQSDPDCRLGCEPIVAVRRPATGFAQVVLLGFQIEFADALDNAVEAMGILLEEHLGVAPEVGP